MVFKLWSGWVSALVSLIWWPLPVAACKPHTHLCHSFPQARVHSRAVSSVPSIKKMNEKSLALSKSAARGHCPFPKDTERTF